VLLCNTLNAVHNKDSVNLIQMDFLQNWMLELGTWHDFNVCQDLPENTISTYLNLRSRSRLVTLRMSIFKIEKHLVLHLLI